jgi:predicted dehydrogenase
MINVGIVGLGFMAATHIKAYRQIPGVRITAICNPSGRRLDGDLSDVTGNIAGADAIKLDMAEVKAYRNYSDLVADDSIDLIDICSHTQSHLSYSIEALQAGRHVLCEKPLARTATLARQIADAAAGARGFFMPAMCLRFWPEWSWLKKAIETQQFGATLGARFRRVAEPPGWGQKHFFDGKQSGGALLDLHIHDVDFVQFCFGRPRSVFATGFTKFSGTIDHVIAQYEVKCGACVHAEGSWAMTPGFGFNMSYTANFENATADYDFSRGPDALKLFEKGQNARTIKCEGPDGFVGELTHILDAIRSGKAPSLVTVQDGVSAVEICEAEEESIKTRQPVFLGGQAHLGNGCASRS